MNAARLQADGESDPGGQRGLLTDTPLIEVKALNKIYRTREGNTIDALKDINCQVANGEFVTLVGPSGCGKSTLLKILAGTLRRTSGSVTLRGEPIGGPSRNVGVVFQSPVLLPWRTVLQNVILPIEIQKQDRATFHARGME